MYCETRGINYFGLKLSWLVGDDPNEFIWVEILKNQTLGKDTKLLAAAFLNLQNFKNRDDYMKELFGTFS